MIAGACAPTRIALPGGAGTPFPDAAPAYEEAVRLCRGVRTLAVTLELSGRAAGTRLRGQVDAGFEAPDKVRLEMRAPIGRPVFILAAPGPDATLYLPRDNRILDSAPAVDIVEALVGLRLGGADLRTLLSGCGFGAAEPTGGRAFEGGWVVVAAADATAYLRNEGAGWRLTAAERAGLTVLYTAFDSGRPSALRLAAPAAKADLAVRLSDVSINVPLEPRVFEVEPAASADPMTLEELRRAGPLGDR
jgi:hypothetical protein